MLSDLAPALLERCRFPTRGERIDCAVSGGADSLALLALSVFAGCEAVAYHVDHGLRPGSSDEADVVAEAAGRLGAGFVSLSVDCAPGPNLEARARSARLGVLPIDIATGHTADDQAETVLLNLLRGSGLDGLAGMTPGRKHPLLALRRFETRALVEELHLSVVEDPSNDDATYRRNRVRHELIPLLGAIAARDLVPVLCRQADLLRDEARFLDEQAGEIPVTNARALADAPVALARRAIRAWLRLAAPPYPPDSAAIGRVLAVACGEVVACEIGGGRRVRRSEGRLILEEVGSSRAEGDG